MRSSRYAYSSAEPKHLFVPLFRAVLKRQFARGLLIPFLRSTRVVKRLGNRRYWVRQRILHRHRFDIRPFYVVLHSYTYSVGHQLRTFSVYVRAIKHKGVYHTQGEVVILPFPRGAARYRGVRYLVKHSVSLTTTSDYYPNYLGYPPLGVPAHSQ
jgi:hypothetical protein